METFIDSLEKLLVYFYENVENYVNFSSRMRRECNLTKKNQSKVGNLSRHSIHVTTSFYLTQFGRI